MRNLTNAPATFADQVDIVHSPAQHECDARRIAAAEIPKAFTQADVFEDLLRTRRDRFAAIFALERRARFEDRDMGAAARQKKTRKESCRARTHDDDVEESHARIFLRGSDAPAAAIATFTVRLFAATKNAGKLAELGELFSAYGVEVLTFPEYDEPEETADTYAGNAAIKAHALHSQLQQAGIRENVIADDSGLEIAALGGKPGVYSARYGGPNATWAQRRASILSEVGESGTDDRRARFVCALCFISADGRELISQGIADGELSFDEHGQLGFGYDPIFYDPSEHATYGEISEAEKNKISHRAKAVQRLMEMIR